MKLEQRLSDTCKLTSTLLSIDAVEQVIALRMLDVTPDEEKVAVVAKVTNNLVKEGWIVGDTITRDDTLIIEYTKTCSPTDVIAAMLSC